MCITNFKKGKEKTGKQCKAHVEFRVAGDIQVKTRPSLAACCCCSLARENNQFPKEAQASKFTNSDHVGVDVCPGRPWQRRQSSGWNFHSATIASNCKQTPINFNCRRRRFQQQQKIKKNFRQSKDDQGNRFRRVQFPCRMKRWFWLFSVKFQWKIHDWLKSNKRWETWPSSLIFIFILAGRGLVWRVKTKGTAIIRRADLFFSLFHFPQLILAAVWWMKKRGGI